MSGRLSSYPGVRDSTVVALPGLEPQVISPSLPPAYTDFFLPLLSRCPSAMGIKNKEGETPGQILGWGPPWDSAEEEEDEEVSTEREWRQKLQGELEDEWQEAIGRFEGEGLLPPERPPPGPRVYALYLTAFLITALSNTHIPSSKQMMLLTRCRSPSPSQPGQIAWLESMPRNDGSS